MVSDGGDPWNSVHRPVEAEPAGEHEEVEVEDRQVEEGEESCQQPRATRCGVVCRGECWGVRSHEVQTKHQHSAQPDRQGT